MSVAADIIPIELGLTAGNGLTLWAPSWREDGEDWEAFLGHEEDLYVFPTAAHLAAFIRTSTEHDLLDHPEWETAADLLVDELSPDDDHRFDIVGVPELVAEPADIWTLAELTDTVAILRSLAEVCGLDADRRRARFRRRLRAAADGSAGVHRAQRREAVERDRRRRRRPLGRGGLDALDGIVTTPEVDAEALEVAVEAEAAAISAVEKRRNPSPARRSTSSRSRDAGSRRAGTRTWSSGTRPASTAWRSPSTAGPATPCGATSGTTRCSCPAAAASRSTPRQRIWRTI